MFNFYKNKWSKKEFKNILSVLILIWVYFCIKALIFYSKNPNAAREIISHQGEQYGNIAIAGGYGLAYGSAVLGVYTFSLVVFNKFQKKYIKSILIIITLLCLMIGVETGSTITLLSLIFGLVYISYSYILGIRNNKTLKYLIRYFSLNTVFITLGMLLLSNLKNIGEWLIMTSRVSDSFLSSRIELIGIQFLYGESTGTLSARGSLYKKSFNTFIENPIFGTVFEHGVKMNLSIGGHSELLDQMAMLGIIGAMPFIIIFYQFIKYERKLNYKQISGAYILPFIVMFVLNPFHASQPYFMLFFIIPALGALVTKNEKRVHIS